MKVLDFVMEKGKASVPEVQRALNLTYKQAREELAKLQRGGKVTLCGMYFEYVAPREDDATVMARKREELARLLGERTPFGVSALYVRALDYMIAANATGPEALQSRFLMTNRMALDIIEWCRRNHFLQSPPREGLIIPRGLFRKAFGDSVEDPASNKEPPMPYPLRTAEERQYADRNVIAMEESVLRFSMMVAREGVKKEEAEIDRLAIEHSRRGATISELSALRDERTRLLAEETPFGVPAMYVRALDYMIARNVTGVKALQGRFLMTERNGRDIMEWCRNNSFVEEPPREGLIITREHFRKAFGDSVEDPAANGGAESSGAAEGNGEKAEATSVDKKESAEAADKTENAAAADGKSGVAADGNVAVDADGNVAESKAANGSAEAADVDKNSGTAGTSDGKNAGMTPEATLNFRMMEDSVQRFADLAALDRAQKKRKEEEREERARQMERIYARLHPFDDEDDDEEDELFGEDDALDDEDLDDEDEEDYLFDEDDFDEDELLDALDELDGADDDEDGVTEADLEARRQQLFERLKRMTPALEDEEDEKSEDDPSYEQYLKIFSESEIYQSKAHAQRSEAERKKAFMDWLFSEEEDGPESVGKPANGEANGANGEANSESAESAEGSAEGVKGASAAAPSEVAKAADETPGESAKRVNGGAVSGAENGSKEGSGEEQNAVNAGTSSSLAENSGGQTSASGAHGEDETDSSEGGPEGESDNEDEDAMSDEEVDSLFAYITDDDGNIPIDEPELWYKPRQPIVRTQSDDAGSGADGTPQNAEGAETSAASGEVDNSPNGSEGAPNAVKAGTLSSLTDVESGAEGSEGNSEDISQGNTEDARENSETADGADLKDISQAPQSSSNSHSPNGSNALNVGTSSSLTDVERGEDDQPCEWESCIGLGRRVGERIAAVKAAAYVTVADDDGPKPIVSLLKTPDVPQNAAVWAPFHREGLDGAAIWDIANDKISGYCALAYLVVANPGLSREEMRAKVEQIKRLLGPGNIMVRARFHFALIHLDGMVERGWARFCSDILGGALGGV